MVKRLKMVRVSKKFDGVFKFLCLFYEKKFNIPYYFLECSVLKQQMSIGIETNEELAKQKESLEKKASRMAQSIAGTYCS